MAIGDSERTTQNKVVDFFKNKDILGYNYMGNLKDKVNKNIDEKTLKTFLKNKGYADNAITSAIAELIRASENIGRGIYTANKEVYALLKYGVKVNTDKDAPPQTIYLIDFDIPTNNIFSIAEEVTVIEKQEKRPDIVIYVNGIAVAIIELKKSSVAVSQGIRQNLTNQKSEFIEKFFSTIQFCMAGNDFEGLRYGTLKTGEKYYMEWKEDGFDGNEDERPISDIRIGERIKSFDNILFKQLYQMFDKERFLDLVHNFVIFDKGIKKVCRYNQFYGIKRTQNRITKKKSGIIWHTQGSGKTLTMVWLSKWVLMNNPHARVLIVTDRDELDDQIEKNFIGVNKKIVRTKSGHDLLEKLNKYDDNLICSLVHKFGKRGGDATEADYAKYIEELVKSLPTDFSAKGDLCVFVDECHRTQSGKLHEAMKAIMPNAIFIGFTGTPLLKKDKATSIEVFGTYIHAYKYNEAVIDGVVLDLRYEYRDIPQDLSSQEKIDKWFEAKTRGLAPRAKAKLKSKWGNMQKVYSSRSRLSKIAWDIVEDFDMKTRLMDGNGNAILVADSIYTACKYYELFLSLGFKKCAIISSYTPMASELRTETVDEDDDTETLEKYHIYLKMLGLDPENLPKSSSIQKRVEKFEEEVKNAFVDEPANMKLLIVVDKLLTGFDAPPCTYLYIDKNMRDHGLFQAICRVNRLDGESKDFGYIVDYKQLFGNLTDAVKDYTSGAFEDYDEEDVKGLIKDRSIEALLHFKNVLDELEELCDGVEYPRGDLQYLHYFCGEGRNDDETEEAYARLREKLYRLSSSLNRAFAEAKPYFTEQYFSDEISVFEEKVKFYIELKEAIGNKSGDFLDYKAYEPDMRKMIDNYIIASDSVKIGEFDDFTLLDFIVGQGDDFVNGDTQGKKDAAAEAIENNIRRKVVEKITINPKYYEKMSAILEQLIEERKQGVEDYKSFLERYIDLAKNVERPEENEAYPEGIRGNKAIQALYDNLGQDKDIAIKIHFAVMKVKQPSFRGDQAKENRIKREIFKILNDNSEVERVFKIISKQEEY